MKFDRCFGCMEEIQGYPCPVCGFDPAQAAAPNYVLPYGTILNGRYVVGKMLGRGGFGITYIGFDLMLQRKVAVKEYFPSGQVSRIAPVSTDLQWLDGGQAGQLRENGVRACLREARKMAKIGDIPEVVRVLDCFQENDTAYIVMDYVSGKTLMSVLLEQDAMTWTQAKEIFVPAMQAMEQVHQAGLVHRDISPDNLMLTPDGRVRILDLGAAKDLAINGGVSSALVVKGGFSPLEQYAQQGGSGPWTDVYAMAATMYHSLTGVIPPTAPDRMQGEPVNWALLASNGVPKHVISALQNAMALNAKERTQSMAELLRQCQSETAVVVRKEPPVSAKKGNFRIIGFAAALCLAAALAAALFVKAKPAPQPVSSPTTMQAVPTRSTATPTESDNISSNHPKSTVSTALETEAANAPEEVSAFQDVQPGDTIKFGEYRAAGDKESPKESIEWLVLEKQDDKILVISVYGLDTLPYHAAGVNTWDGSYIRKWLNEYFYENAFSDAEKASIAEITVTPEKVWDCSPGEETVDHVFLFSRSEVNAYIQNNVYLRDIDATLHCKPAKSVKTQDIYVNDDGYGWWWLRNTTRNNTAAYRITSEGRFDTEGYELNTKRGLVRPAMWIRAAA